MCLDSPSLERPCEEQENHLPDEKANRLSVTGRRNSLAMTKTLFARSDVRSTSFTTDDVALGGFSFQSHFEWQGRLGSGSFADVYAVRHKKRPKERYAVKVIRKEFKSYAERAAYLHEAELANKLPKHAHVVGYLRAWQDAQIMYVQMELCEGGTLREHMGAMHLTSAETQVWQLTKHVAKGLAHIHAHSMLHCDIKPDNVLIDARGLYKIGDLGQATALATWNEHEGDPRYLSRDLLELQPTPAADIFSLGAMVRHSHSLGANLPYATYCDHLRTPSCKSRDEALATHHPPASLFPTQLPICLPTQHPIPQVHPYPDPTPPTILTAARGQVWRGASRPRR
jgi:serine/threonine protein kinase